MKNRILTLACTALLCACLLLAGAAALAEPGGNAPVNYLDPTRTSAEQTCAEYTLYTGEADLASGWYVISGNVQAESRIEISGSVNLILLDGAVLDATQGIHVTGENRLAIWAQSDDATSAGRLTAIAPDYCAAIGGDEEESGGALTFNGGAVTATGGDSSAGIGGGDGGAGGAVTVNGGAVTATGSDNGAGIGGGNGGAGGAVEVNGGAVTATGGNNGAGIGGGNKGTGDAVAVNGGAVTATGGAKGAGIGGGNGGAGGSVTFSGGAVTAIAGKDGQAVGRGRGSGGEGGLTFGDGMMVHDSETSGQPTLTAERLNACRGAWARVEPCDHPSNTYGICNHCGLHVANDAIPYIDPTDADDSQKVCEQCGVLTVGLTRLTTGWYAANERLEIGERIDISGDVNIILTDGAQLTAARGFRVTGENRLTIWAQSMDPATAGRLTAIAPEYCAGIGGGDGEPGGAVTVNGGTVTAIAGEGGQAIGHGRGRGSGSAGSLILYDGMRVYDNDTAAHGVVMMKRISTCRGAWARIEVCTHRFSVSQNVCLNCGATVETPEDDPSDPFDPDAPLPPVAYTDPTDSLIPNRHRNNYTVLTGQQTELKTGWYVVNDSMDFGERIYISGDVHIILTDGVQLTAAQGIELVEGNSLTIWGQSDDVSTSGRLTAIVSKETEGTYSKITAGIGGSMYKTGGTLTVNGGIVTATGGESSAGIGGGYDGAGGTVTVNGGVVKATCGDCGAGIGGGDMGAGGTVTVNGGVVTATGGDCGAGIGGGYDGAGGAVTVNGGTLTATGGAGGAGIGGGSRGAGGAVTISGGSVIAIADGGQAVGHGKHGGSEGSLAIDGMRVFNDVAAAQCVPAANRASACRGAWAWIETCDHLSSVEEGVCAYCGATIEDTNDPDDPENPENPLPPVAYLDPSDPYAPDRQRNDYAVLTGGQAGLGSGWYVVNGSVAFDERIGISGDVNIILTDGSALNAAQGIHVTGENSLTIWAQSDDASKAGRLTATADESAAGIGGNSLEPGGIVTVMGGVVTASGHKAIGAGQGGIHPGSLTVGNGLRACVQTGESTDQPQPVSAEARAHACQSNLWARIEPCDDQATYVSGRCRYCRGPSGLAPIRYAFDVMSRVPVYNSCHDYTLFESGLSRLTTGWYVVTSKQEIDERIEVSGDVHIIFDVNTCFYADKGIHVPEGSSLTIWSTERYDRRIHSGFLMADGLSRNAGIGGNEGEACGSVTINGGHFVIDNVGAGIGGGYGGACGTITINDGIIECDNPHGDGAGIGVGGDYWGYYGGTIIINGGEVTAIGGYYDQCNSGIGGHYTTVTINGGTVTATGGVDRPGIGGDYATVTINGGTVTATGGVCKDNRVSGSVGIGGRTSSVRINGGVVKAYGKGGASIGGRDHSEVVLSWTSAQDEINVDCANKSAFYNYTGNWLLLKSFIVEWDIGTDVFEADPYHPFPYGSTEWMILRPYFGSVGHEPSVKHTIAISDDIEHGTVTADRESAGSGDIVTLTLDPDEGYLAAYAQWSDGSVTHRVTAYGGVCRFLMPDADATVSALFVPAFGAADFALPEGLSQIGPNAFEGIAAGAVDVPDACASIGDHAFRDCANLTAIRIPAFCKLGEDVFDACPQMYVYGYAGSSADNYCASHDNCVFVDLYEGLE